MHTPVLTTQKLKARIDSTRELLRQLAQEADHTTRQIGPTELSAELWFRFRSLAQAIHNTAADADLLADLLATLINLPPAQREATQRTAV